MTLLTKKLKVGLQLLPAKPVGRLKDNLKIILNRNDFEKFYRLASEWNIRWNGRSNYFKRGCPAGTERIAIDIFGNVYPCDFLQTTYGNILKESLKNIYRSMSNSSKFKLWSAVCRSAMG